MEEMFHVKHRADYPPGWKPGLLWSECWIAVAQAWLGQSAKVRAGGRSGRVAPAPCVELEEAMFLMDALEYKVQV